MPRVRMMSQCVIKILTYQDLALRGDDVWMVVHECTFCHKTN
jgi:hypothetical protein